jgi:hypothetical protein
MKFLKKILELLELLLIMYFVVIWSTVFVVFVRMTFMCIKDGNIGMAIVTGVGTIVILLADVKLKNPFESSKK